MTHFWRIKKWLPERFNQKCKLIVPWSKNGNVLVEFEDGQRYVTSKWFVRQIKCPPS